MQPCANSAGGQNCAIIRLRHILLALLLAAGAGASRRSGSTVQPGGVFDAARLGELDAAIVRAVSDGRCPGGVLWLERSNVVHRRAYGQRSVQPRTELMSEDTVFDAASLTKVVATTSAVMKLVERRQVGLDEPVSRYLPKFIGQGRESILVRHLLSHTSGLRPGLPLSSGWKGRLEAFDRAYLETPETAPGTAFRYSDINFILLGALVESVSGRVLDDFCQREVFGPLRMRDTHFRRDPDQRQPVAPWRIAPTERLTNGVVLRAVVHDPVARRMGGVAGHAGLFTSAADLARFARMMLNKGALDGVRVFRPETVRLMTTVQTPESVPERRGLGWDVDSPYAGPRGSRFPVGSFGHTGWTGTSIWIDPFSGTFVIFLSNRNHPTEAGNIVALRRQIGTLAAGAVRGFDWEHVAGALPRREPPASAQTNGAPVLLGIDVLARDQFRPLQGLKVGLITNHTGRDKKGRSTIDLLHGAPGVSLRALFSPEHGIRGTQDGKVRDDLDAATGLRVFSLYGEFRAPRPEQLEGLDALVFDIQDIGCRFYTYGSTMGLCMEAAARARLKFFVLDRVNPIGGSLLDGPVLSGPRSFVAWHEIPVRHGMTLGELAQLFNVERGMGVDLRVIRCEGWHRGQWLDATDIPWVNPSPNMRSLAAAALYPGVGLIEFCDVSVGRGTATPFEVVGAPYVKAEELASRLRAERLEGIAWETVRFTPTASKFAGQECQGVRIRILARDRIHPCDVGVALAKHLHGLYPERFHVEKMEKLLGDAPTLEAIRRGRPGDEFRRLWSKQWDQFESRRRAHLLYR